MTTSILSLFQALLFRKLFRSITVKTFTPISSSLGISKMWSTIFFLYIYNIAETML